MMYLHGRDRRWIRVLAWTTLAIAATLAASSPAVPADSPEWKPFGFRSLGVIFEVPPGFELANTTEDGQGATFQTLESGYLAVWGDNLPLQEFKAAVRAQLRSDEAQGWNVSYRRITPTWAKLFRDQEWSHPLFPGSRSMR